MSVERAAAILGDVADPEPTTLELVWPTLRSEARYGLAGEFLDLVGPETEADPAALLVTFLAAFGALVGRGPHALADGAEHPARIWPLVVGDTAKSRKGTSWQQVHRFLLAADKRFALDRVQAGFGSGEALVDAVAGDGDHRLLVVEPEYGRVLSVCKREGSTLPALLRQAWDGSRLQVRSRAGTAVADGAHVSVIGHITKAELLARLAESDALGGSLNRFVVVGARRSKLLPSGGNLDDAEIADFGRNVAFVATQARAAGILVRAPEAEEYWTGLYEGLAGDAPSGLLGAVIARDSAQVLRLSVTFALLDRSRYIQVPHIVAAQATWDYSRASAAGIFGERTGNVIADQILAELQARGSEGLDGTAIRDLLSRHARKEQIDLATAVLVQRGLATKATKSTTRGRPLTVLTLATKATKATKVEERRSGGGTLVAKVAGDCDINPADEDDPSDEPPPDEDDHGEQPPDEATLIKWCAEAESVRRSG